MFKKLTKGFTVMLINGIVLLTFSPSANSADFPKKPVTIVVAAGVGGGEDTEARGIAPYLAKHLGVAVSITNTPGAGGKIAFEKFQKTEPDGYTLITSSFPKSIVIECMGQTNYRTSDFTQVFVWGRSTNFLMVNSESWKTFDEWLKAAKSKTFSGGNPGVGSTSHLFGLLAANELGIKVNWVPFDGSAGAAAALAGKHIDFTIGSASSYSPLIKAGKLRPLLLFSDTRDPYLSDVPIPTDVGFNISTMPVLRGADAPPNTPPSIVKVFEEAFSRSVKEPGFIEFAKKYQLSLYPLHSKEYSKIVTDIYSKKETFIHLLSENAKQQK